MKYVKFVYYIFDSFEMEISQLFSRQSIAV